MSQAQERFELRFDHSLIREAFKKNLKIQTFFLDFIGFFLKVLGKFWKWPGNAKKKNHFCVCVWGVGGW